MMETQHVSIKSRHIMIKLHHIMPKPHHKTKDQKNKEYVMAYHTYTLNKPNWNVSELNGSGK